MSQLEPLNARVEVAQSASLACTSANPPHRPLSSAKGVSVTSTLAQVRGAPRVQLTVPALKLPPGEA